MAVRMTWKGQLNLGLVSVPVGFTTAVREQGVKFNQFTADHHPVGRQAFDKETGEILSASDVHKGYKVGDTVVLLTDDELDSLAPQSTKALDVVSAVAVSDIDPMLYASHNWLVPQTGAEAAYALLVSVLAETGLAAVATTVSRNKEHVVAIRSNGKSLIASFLHYVDEIVPCSVTVDSGEAGALEQHKVLMTSLVSGMQKPAESLAEFTDTHRAKVLDFVTAKASGVAPEVSADITTNSTLDLLEALKVSVSQ